MNKNIGCGAGAPQGGKGLETMKRAVCFSPIIKRLCALLALGGLTCLLCACGAGAEDPGAGVVLGSTDLLYEDGRVSGELCEGVTVDADIPNLSAVTSYDIVSAHMTLPDEDVLRSMRDYVFAACSEDEIQQVYTEEDQRTNYYVDGDTEYYRDYIVSICRAPGQQNVSLWKFYDYPHEPFVYDPTLMYDFAFSPFETQRDFDFMKREDAVRAVCAQLAEWEIETIGEPIVFCMDGDGMYEYLTQMYEWNQDPTPVKQEDKADLEGYFMVFDTGYHNIPYTCFERGSVIEETYTYGAQLWVFFTAKGIIRLDYGWADYEIDGTLEEHDAPVTLDQALSQVRTRYEDLVVTSAVEIENIFFQYVPQNPDSETGSVTLVPAWVFQPQFSATAEKAERKEVGSYEDVIMIHAITGKFIT